MKERKKCLVEGCENMGKSWGRKRGYKKLCGKHLKERREAKKTEVKSV